MRMGQHRMLQLVDHQIVSFAFVAVADVDECIGGFVRSAASVDGFRENSLVPVSQVFGLVMVPHSLASVYHHCGWWA